MLGDSVGQDEHGNWWICVPVSRLCSTLIAWLLVALGVAATISKRTVARWLKAEGLKPWRFRSWITPKCLLTFLDRARPILDLYESIRSLGANEIVWSADEKPSIQARGRDSYKPSGKGEPAHLEATYTRNGAVQLFAAMNVLTGYVLAEVKASKTFESFQNFLVTIATRSAELGFSVVHIILDNASIHRPQYLETWLAETFPELRVVIHWLPVRSSWLNQIENYFSKLQTHVLTPNFYDSIEWLTKVLLEYISLWNLAPRPINWTYTSTDLYRKYNRQIDPGIWGQPPGSTIW